MITSRRTVGLAALAAVATLAGTAMPVGAGAQEPPFQVVADGLNNPRYLTFSPSGDLFVVEAGSGGAGPCVVHPGGLGTFCFGFSGSVTRVSDRGAEKHVLTGLPSIQSDQGETLGPSDIAFQGDTKFVISVGLGSDVEFRDGFGDDGALLATLVTGKLQRDEVSLFADVLANEASANPDGTDIDSNPVGLLRQGNGYYLADAGGNAVVRVDNKGSFSTLTALPPTASGADSVPTAVEKGPDGAFYISQLTGFPFEPGAANIWRVVPGQDPTVWASGLTNVTDLAFAKDGTLYAVEIASEGLLNGPIGSLVKVTPGSGNHETIIGGLFAPYGVALTKNAAYVSIGTVLTGGGQVIKVPLD